MILAQELQWQYHLHVAINAIHINHLDHIESRPEFSGIRGVGVQLEAALHDSSSSRNEGSGTSDTTLDTQGSTSISPQVTKDLSSNDEVIECEQDVLYTQMLVNYIDDIYDWYFDTVYSNCSLNIHCWTSDFINCFSD